MDQHLARLRAVPAHGNRVLHVDQLFLGLLCSFFEPMARSLRSIQDQGNFDGRIDLPRLARSTTADALKVVDPALLLPLISDLRARCPQLARTDLDLSGITRQIIAADGTYLNTIVDVAWALAHTKSNGKRQAQVRANVQIDAISWTPQVLSISGDDKESEPAAFVRDLLGGVLYVVDRNFCDFSFIKAIIDKQSDLVLRVRSNAPRMQVIQELALTPADAEAGVSSDQLVALTGRAAPAGTFRLVTIQSRDRNNQPSTIRLLTSLTDASSIGARVIGSVYRLRWQIELFFKWLKTFARMDHLLSTSRRGITFQLYVMVIAVLIMQVQTGRRISVYALQSLSRVAAGRLSIDEAMEIITRRDREREMDRARQAKRRARKKLS